MNDLTGKKFGKWSVIKRNGSNKHKQAMWLCICDCGKVSNVIGSNMVFGISSCCNKKGCTSEVKQKKIKKKPIPIRIRNILKGMKSRCYNEKAPNYIDYGKRGITICDDWLRDSSLFYKWVADSCYNDKLFIDRIDNDRGYSPENCRFVSRLINNNNKRSYKNNITGYPCVSRQTGCAEKYRYKKYKMGNLFISYGYNSAKEADEALKREVLSNDNV